MSTKKEEESALLVHLYYSITVAKVKGTGTFRINFKKAVQHRIINDRMEKPFKGRQFVYNLL